MPVLWGKCVSGNFPHKMRGQSMNVEEIRDIWRESITLIKCGLVEKGRIYTDFAYAYSDMRIEIVNGEVFEPPLTNL